MSDTNVDVEDPTFIEIEVGDDETALAGGVEPKKPDPAAAPAPVSAKVTPAVTTAADEAAASLNEQIRRANADRDAAMATAAAERHGREQAEQARQRAAAEAAEAQAEATNSRLSIITSGIEAATRELASGKTAYKNAHESGDADAMADAQISMGRATAKLDRLTADKEAFEAESARRKDGGAARAEPAPDGPQGRERWLLNFPPRPQAWLRSHPECMPVELGGNPERHRAMMDAHKKTVESGIREGTDAYFDTVDQMLGYREPTSAAAVTTAAGGVAAAAVTAARAEPTPVTPKPRAQPMPAAPPSSATPSAGGGPRRSQTVKLNAQQQEIARLSYTQNKNESEDAWLKRAYGTYAKHLIEATNDGTIGRKSH